MRLATGRRLTSTLGIGLLLAASCSPAIAASNAFDGRWSVALACPDTTDRNGLVKGYEFVFAVTIHEGAIEGQYGAPGQPASLLYSGHVDEDGALEIAAHGNTGQSAYTVGKVAQGTRYGYTMQGRLQGSTGEAVRRELRPCTARFSRTGV